MTLLCYRTGFLSSSLGLDLPIFGVRPFPFGSCLVTSVGMMGLDTAFIPFPPFARVPLLVMVGGIKKKPVVIDGEVCRNLMLQTQDNALEKINIFRTEQEKQTFDLWTNI